jgi:hypothetical protein
MGLLSLSYVLNRSEERKQRSTLTLRSLRSLLLSSAGIEVQRPAVEVLRKLRREM